MNRLTSVLLVLGTTLATALPLAAQQPAAPAAPAAPAPAAQAAPRAQAPRARVSPHDTISAVIGGRGGPRVTITYGRPYSARGGVGEPRKIWGGLVPWGKADRLGADEATTLTTELPLVIGETTLPAGGYVLYIVPSETGASKLAFSSHLGKWGIPVDETKDVARFDLQESDLENSVDQLTLSIANDQATGGGVIKIQWEKTQFALPFTVKK